MWKSKVGILGRNGRNSTATGNLLKRLRHERYAKTGGYQPQHAECAIRFLSRNLGHESRGTAMAHEQAMIRWGCPSNRNKFLIRQRRQPKPPLLG